MGSAVGQHAQIQYFPLFLPALAPKGAPTPTQAIGHLVPSWAVAVGTQLKHGALSPPCTGLAFWRSFVPCSSAGHASPCCLMPEEQACRVKKGQDLFSCGGAVPVAGKSACHSPERLWSHPPWRSSCLDMVLGTLLWVSLLGRGLDKTASRGPFQPLPFINTFINS